MIKIFILAGICMATIFISCTSTPEKADAQVSARDKSVTAAESYSDLFIDSTVMEKFIVQQGYKDSLANRLRSFYNNRNYQCAWFFKEGIADYAATFYDMYNDYINYSGDSSLYNPVLLQLYDSANSGNLKPGDSLAVKTELLLTVQFFRYARKAYQGNNQLNAKELDWFIPRKKINPAAVLDSMLANKGKNIADYEPVNKQYNLLKQQLVKYYGIEKKGGWKIITADRKTYKLNDSAACLTNIKKRLLLTGDINNTDTSAVFTKELEDGIKNFQHRYGFKENGVINTALIAEMNRPVEERLQQILINMERIRWMPAQPTTDFLLVNIPEFRLHVYEKGQHAFSMNVVTGSVVHNTVIFNGNLKYIVFSPYWNVPTSILKKEVLPGIARNKNYLASHNMEWNNGAVRQKPGLSNSLGLVKFLFPNSYDIYLHDSPAKSLFSEATRAFSHGCIRLGEPKKLAQFLLRNDAAWDSVKITNAMNAGKEQYLTLKETIPVFIGYFTAWVDGEGKLNFRDDIYGHDKKMKARLFGK
ncbi:L,D-transpeptidase family protein [Ferruginibacter sp. SUN106]|uniref:L,D-transpeptidase family protein n=1 Tax=Ferruginibacter sp. SUN106 TaxID=2978348 RepID=UPI003D35D753